MLIKAVEHTWGGQKDLWTGWYETRGWSNVDFAIARNTTILQRQEASWAEQRQYFDSALAVLGMDSALAAAIRSEISKLDHAAAVTQPDPSMRQVPVRDRVVLRPASGDPKQGFALRFDSSGAIVLLRVCDDADCAEGRSWASTQDPLARFVYKTHSPAEGMRYYNNYSFVNANWGPQVFTKVGLNSTEANASTTYASVESIHANSSAMVVVLRMPLVTTRYFGAPQSLRLILALPSMREGLQITLVVVNKTTTRLPEEAWLEFRPALSPHTDWSFALDKTGSWVDPSEVLVNGSRTLHGVGDGGVLFQPLEFTLSSRLRLTSLDAGLVSPGGRANMDMYAFPGSLPRPQDGVAFSLWNNIWNCNYIYWYPYRSEDATFALRFGLTVENASHCFRAFCSGCKLVCYLKSKQTLLLVTGSFIMLLHLLNFRRSAIEPYPCSHGPHSPRLSATAKSSAAAACDRTPRTRAAPRLPPRSQSGLGEFVQRPPSPSLPQIHSARRGAASIPAASATRRCSRRSRWNHKLPVRCLPQITGNGRMLL